MISIEVIEKALDKAIQKGAFSLQDVQIISEHLNSLKMEVSKLQMVSENYFNNSEVVKQMPVEEAEVVKPSKTKK